MHVARQDTESRGPACEKGASNWLTVIPLKDMDFDLNKREFRDAVRLRYHWSIPDNPSVCVCGSVFTVDHAMICQRRGLVIQRHNEIRDLQAELLDMVCYDVQVEPALQPITDEQLARRTNQAPDARLDVHRRGFWERQRAAFFDIRVCHPNADSYRDLSPKQIYRIHENEKKRKYNSRVTEIEQGTFTPLVFTTTEGMADECLRYHSRLAELLICKKARELRHNNFMGQAESVLCNFVLRAPMPKGIENPEKEELRCWGQE